MILSLTVCTRLIIWYCKSKFWHLVEAWKLWEKNKLKASQNLEPSLHWLKTDTNLCLGDVGCIVGDFPTYV